MWTHPSEVRAYLRQLDFHPSKVLGQNFLIDGNILHRMVDEARLKPSDHVLEIGPGLGVLTGPLLEAAGRVTAVEKDRRLHAHLVDQFGEHPGLTLLQADIMEVDLEPLLESGVNKVVSNLPYSVGTRALINLVEQPAHPETLLVTLQLDVVERLAAQPDTKAFGAVSVLAQSRYHVRLLKVISPTCFYPAPQVRSALVLLERRSARDVLPHDRPHLRALVKYCFGQRRKQMGRLLAQAPEGLCAVDPRPALEQVGAMPVSRPGTLSPEAWVKLTNLLLR